MTKILIIEDDRAIREAVVDILEIENYEVVSAADGQAGLEAARKERPHLILCDIMMPYLDGYGVLTELRKSADTATLPFIFLTARTAPHDVRQGMNLGADGYLTKPFRPEDLLRAIEMRLTRQAQLAEKLQSRINEMQNTLLSVLPHELNTPLHGLLAGIEFLRDDFESLEPSDVQELLWIMHESAQRMRRIIANTLLHAELELMAERGEVATPTSETIDIATTVESIARQEAAAVTREADLHLQLEEALLHISPLHLAKVAEELINNAFKFSPTGTPVEVASHIEGNQVVLTITNHGRGMSSEEVQDIRAFHQFRRHRYEQQGLGLGLSITQRLLALYQGSLHIESVQDERTIVQAFLPLTSVATSANGRPS
jgi:two-component system sensor histidine kinase/response regulator